VQRVVLLFLNFLSFYDGFDKLISKMNFFLKKYYLEAFPSEKHFEKQYLPLLIKPLMCF